MAETTPDTESDAAPASPRENVISSRGYDGRREEWTSCNGSGHRPLCVDAERLGASKVGRRRVVRGPFDGGGDASIEAADGGRVHLMKSSRSLSDLAAAPEVVEDASPRWLLAANAALAYENARLRSCEERDERRRRADKALIETLRNRLKHHTMLSSSKTSLNGHPDAIHTSQQLSHRSRDEPRAVDASDCSEQKCSSSGRHFTVDRDLEDLLQDDTLGGNSSLHSISEQQSDWTEETVIKLLHRKNNFPDQQQDTRTDFRIDVSEHAMSTNVSSDEHSLTELGRSPAELEMEGPTIGTRPKMSRMENQGSSRRAKQSAINTPQQLLQHLREEPNAIDASELSECTARTFPSFLSSSEYSLSEHTAEQFATRGRLTAPSRLCSRTLSRQQSQESAHRARRRPDEEVLAQSIADAGSNAFGCIFVEMWVLSDDGTKLTRPDGGHWMNPAFASSLPSRTLIAKAWELDRTAVDCPLGAGLAGTLADESSFGSGRVHWRQIKALLKDPFVQRQSGGRIRELYEVGIGLVASVPFLSLDGKGIVLYFSRQTADPKLLQSPINVRFMTSCANLIGAGFLIRKSRDHLSEVKRKQYVNSVRKVKKEMFKGAGRGACSIASMVLDQEVMESLRTKHAVENTAKCGDGLNGVQEDLVAVKIAKRVCLFSGQSLKRIVNSRKKWRGSHFHGPPRQSFSASLFAFAGVFLVMFTILKVEKALEEVDSNFHFDGSWHIGTLCIVFALTPAPVGQPRQIITAHLWNMLVGLACKQIPNGGAGDYSELDSSGFGMSLIWRQSLAVALGVSGQAYIGILHPPASGLSFAFALSPEYSWRTIAPVMLVDAIIVIMSMLILNLSENRQYPLWWLGLGWSANEGATSYTRRMTRRARRRFSGAIERDLSLPVIDTSPSIRLGKKKDVIAT